MESLVRTRSETGGKGVKTYIAVNFCEDVDVD
jgi:hypothetical protein